MLPNLVITSGEPAGIGPDICLTLMQDRFFCTTMQNRVHLTVLGCPKVFNSRAVAMKLPLLEKLTESALWSFKPMPILTKQTVVTGKPNPRHSNAVLEMIQHATLGCLSDKYAGMITAPIQKSAVINGGYPLFQGHTEYLAELCSKANEPPLQSVMMLTEAHLVAKKSTFPPFRVCLLTTHVPLSSVATIIENQSLMLKIAAVVAKDLTCSSRYGLQNPSVAVLGLNPHAGEDGKIGDEEIRLIAPFVEECQFRFPQVHWVGPISADTAFIPDNRRRFDAYLGAYHDQVLPVFKAIAFGSGVNVTLGLPIIRTSVDHGTALSLAGTGKASTEGLRSAIEECLYLAS